MLVAAVAATTYRESAGPAIGATTSENIGLNHADPSLNSDLNDANDTIEQLKIGLLGSRSEHGDLRSKFESYPSSALVLEASP